MTGYLNRYKRSWLYRAYLRHGIRAWGNAKGLGLLSIFPFGFFVGTWWVLVHLPALLIGLTISEFTSFEPGQAVYWACLFSVILLLPITVSVFCEFFIGYFACISLARGEDGPANRLLRNHQEELASIENAI